MLTRTMLKKYWDVNVLFLPSSYLSIYGFLQVKMNSFGSDHSMEKGTKTSSI
uniref:Uncharacterized protein n=1 Tax=Arundo donax TaxID=35708 RepID=A0A0A8XPV9_ARUDO